MTKLSSTFLITAIELEQTVNKQRGEIHELEKAKQALLNACEMFITWNENKENAPTFHEMEVAIMKAFRASS